MKDDSHYIGVYEVTGKDTYGISRGNALGESDYCNEETAFNQAIAKYSKLVDPEVIKEKYS